MNNPKTLVGKLARAITRQFTEKEIQIANKHEKNFQPFKNPSPYLKKYILYDGQKVLTKRIMFSKNL